MCKNICYNKCETREKATLILRQELYVRCCSSCWTMPSLIDDTKHENILNKTKHDSGRRKTWRHFTEKHMFMSPARDDG